MIYSILLSSKASEESSRMTTMSHSTKNCSKFIDELALKINKLRQENITRELIEIISSSKAIENHQI